MTGHSDEEPAEDKPIFFQGDVDFLRNWAEHPVSLDNTMAAREKALRLARRIEAYLERERSKP